MSNQEQHTAKVRPRIMVSSNNFLISATALPYFYFRVKNIRLL